MEEEIPSFPIKRPDLIAQTLTGFAADVKEIARVAIREFKGSGGDVQDGASLQAHLLTSGIYHQLKEKMKPMVVRVLRCKYKQPFPGKFTEERAQTKVEQVKLGIVLYLFAAFERIMLTHLHSLRITIAGCRIVYNLADSRRPRNV